MVVRFSPKILGLNVRIFGIIFRQSGTGIFGTVFGQSGIEFWDYFRAIRD